MKPVIYILQSQLGFPFHSLTHSRYGLEGVEGAEHGYENYYIYEMPFPRYCRCYHRHITHTHTMLVTQLNLTFSLMLSQCVMHIKFHVGCSSSHKPFLLTFISSHPVISLYLVNQKRSSIKSTFAFFFLLPSPTLMNRNLNSIK